MTICSCCRVRHIVEGGYCPDCQPEVEQLHRAAELRDLAETVKEMSPAGRATFRAQLDELVSHV